MICPFCSQWNPTGERRCCFCDNNLNDSEDRTFDGQPGYLKNTKLNFIVSTSSDKQVSSSIVNKIDLRWIIRGIAALPVLIVLYYSLCR